MNRWLFRMAGLAAAAVVAASAVSTSAETFSLQMKRLETTGPPSDYMFRSVYSQRFYRQTGVTIPGRTGQDGEAEFAKVITKEPASYNSKFPFRAVAKLGTQQFGFVLDSAKAEEKPAEDERPEQPVPPPAGARALPNVPSYSRLLFDLNHNGDLTDDAVIEAISPPAGVRYPAGYSNFSFPRVDLTVDADGTKIEYAFLLSGYSSGRYLNENQAYQYVSASLSAAAYREGEITLDGQKMRIVVTDYNCNGRFDDLSAPDPSIRYSDGSVYLRTGDMIYVDPKPQSAYGYDPTTSDAQNHLAKIISLGGRFHDLQITAAGDKLTLEPSPLAVGHVSNSNRGYRALVYGDLGALKIKGDAEGRAPLPAGKWQLQSYTIDRTGYDEPEGQTDAGPSLLQSLAGALLNRAEPDRPKFTMVSARASGEKAAFEVRAGETAELRFGPPYTPRVSASYLQGDRLSLGMSLVGVGGEACSNLVVDGARPAKPTFTITDPDGKVVESGSFEYG